MLTTSVSDTAPQPWITMGYYCQFSKKTTKAIYFAHKVRILYKFFRSAIQYSELLGQLSAISEKFCALLMGSLPVLTLMLATHKKIPVYEVSLRCVELNVPNECYTASVFNPCICREV